MLKKKTEIKNLLNRYLKGIYSKLDVSTLCNEIVASEDMRSMLKETMDNAWEDASQRQASSAEKEQYEMEAKKLFEHVNKQPVRVRLIPYLKYAAVVAITIISLAGGYEFLKWTRIQTVTYTTVTTKYKERKRIELPDKTIVTLNAGSVIRYPSQFLDDTRIVELEGEAYFDVTEDKYAPFIVKSEIGSIKVLGTSFNVKSYAEDEIKTVCVEAGKVEVSADNLIVNLLPNEVIFLNTKTGDHTKQRENAKHVAGWIKGSLYFNRTPLQEVVLELRRIYDKDIVFASNTNCEVKIYGQHENKSLESVLNSIEYSTGIKHRQEGGQIILYIDKR